MSWTDDIERIVEDWQSGHLTSLELESRMMAVLWRLPFAERDAGLRALAARSDEAVRNAAIELQALAQNDALSRDADYVRQNSPLRPGMRLELFGGYDYYASQGKPWWLNGHECYRATFLGFASCGEDAIPAAVVEFDEAIALPGHAGRYGILRASPSSRAIAWGGTEEVVAVHVRQARPADNLAAERSALDLALAAETHATCRVEGTD